jgi:NADH-quinone oxidoreductase subunit J
MNAVEASFFVLSAAAVLGALILVIGARSTVGAALGAVGSSVAVAGLFALLSAPFLFIAQLLLVTGASLVGLLFVVLLVDLEADRLATRTLRRRLVSGFGVIATASLMGVLALSLESTRRVDLPVDSDLGGAFAMGRALYGDFAPVLVALSLAMLTALVATRVLTPEAAPRPPGASAAPRELG